MRGAVAAACAAGLLVAACTSETTDSQASRRPLASPVSSPSVSAAQRDLSGRAEPAAFRRLCRHPPAKERKVTPAGAMPPAMRRVSREVEEIRGLRLKRPVAPEAITRRELAAALRSGLSRSFPRAMQRRRGRAWIAMGAIPPGTDLHRALVDYVASHVIGFYDTLSHRLVFIGSDTPSPYQRVTLAHELTHAIDDQNFDLGRADKLESACRDEELAAFSSLAEGDAVDTSLEWARRTLTAKEKIALEREAAAGSSAGAPATPQFLQSLMIFPYPNGRAFVQALRARGGRAAVNAAFRHPPTSTEQILHPEKYPADSPQQVKVPRLASSLGSGWSALDALDVGEGWLLSWLSLRLSHQEASRAAAGWDGGRYGAWAKGRRTAVVLESVWDTHADARQFADALRRWTRDRPAAVTRGGLTVRALFATDHGTLRALESAA